METVTVTDKSKIDLLALAAQGGDRQRLEELWRNVERYIRWTARRRLHLTGVLAGAEFDDLIQEGYFALVEAVENYDPEKGGFLTILAYKLLTKFAEMQGLRAGHDALNRAAVSLDAPIGEDGDAVQMADFIPDPQAEAELDGVNERIFQSQLQQALTKALDALPPNRREVVKARFFESKTLKQVGLENQISPERARVLEFEALRQLRQGARLYGLDRFVEQQTPYYKHYSLNYMRRTQTSPVEAIYYERERLRQQLEDPQTCRKNGAENKNC